METARKILVADDSITIQRVFERTLPAEEFQLFFATDGQQAIEKAAEVLPHLIIADINMPSKGGVELCEELKKDPKLGQIPVLLLVGVLDDFDEEEVKRVGAAGYLVKPFEAEVALAKIREALVQAPSWEEEEIIDLTDVVEEPEAKEAEEAPAEEAFVLESPLKELEQFMVKEEKPSEEERVEGAEEVSLDLSLEEISLEEVKAPEAERIEQVLEESAAELERIEGAEEEPVLEEEFVKAFEEEFAPAQVQQRPPRIAPGELEEALRKVFRAMAQEIVKALSEEIRRAVKEALKEEER